MKLRGYAPYPSSHNGFRATSRQMQQKRVPNSIYVAPIFIRGVCGRLHLSPPSASKSLGLEDFKLNLFSVLYIMTTRQKRWNNLSQGFHYFTCVGNFEASFFKLAEQMDPGARLLRETSFETILDAGMYLIG